MLVRVAALFFAVGFLVSSCTIPGVGDTPSMGECLGIIRDHSPLMSQISSGQNHFQCEHATMDGVKGMTGAYAAVLDPQISPRYPGADFDTLFIMFAKRYNEPVQNPSPFDASKGSPGYHTTKLPGTVPVKIGVSTLEGDPYAFRSDDPKIAYGCVFVQGVGSAGYPFQVIVCRSTTREASDEVLLSMAKGQVANDFYSLNP